MSFWTFESVAKCPIYIDFLIFISHFSESLSVISPQILWLNIFCTHIQSFNRKNITWSEFDNSNFLTKNITEVFVMIFDEIWTKIEFSSNNLISFISLFTFSMIFAEFLIFWKCRKMSNLFRYCYFLNVKYFNWFFILSRHNFGLVFWWYCKKVVRTFCIT